MSHQSAHIPVSLLWEYANGGPLEATHLRHLASCQDCLAIVWLSKSSESLEDLKRWLKDHNVTAE